MKVFISYAHADAQGFAERTRELCLDLKHEVWMDQSGGIRAGDRFDVSIEQGLKNADVVVAILTPGAVRDKGFCRNEHLYAMDHGKRLIPIKYLECNAPVYMYTLKYLDFPQNGDKVLDELRQSLTTGKLHDLPKEPIDSAPSFSATREIVKLAKNLVPRPWLQDEVERAFHQDREAGVLITGLPGIGKSSFLAHLASRDDRVGGVHFCRSHDHRTLEPIEFVKSLSKQLSNRFPQLGDSLKHRKEAAPGTATALLRDIVLDLIEKTAQPDSTWIVVDALDDSHAQAGHEILAILTDILPLLPSWLKILCASPPYASVTQQIRGMKRISLDEMRDQTQSDVKEFLRWQIESGPPNLMQRVEQDSVPKDELVEMLAGVSSNSFLYAKSVIQEYARGNIASNDISRLPPDMSSFYSRLFSGRFANLNDYTEQIAPVLGLITFSQQPLRVDTIASFVSIQTNQVMEKLEQLQGLVDDTSSMISLGHPSLYEWIRNPSQAKKYHIPAQSTHSTFAAACKNWQEYLNHDESYPLRWGATHAVFANDQDGFCEFILNPEYRKQFKQLFGEEEFIISLGSLVEQAAFREALIESVETGEDASLAADLGLLWFRQDRLDEAQRLWDAAIRYSEPQQKWDLLATSLARRGWVESSRGHRTDAEDFYRRCKDVATTHQSKPGLLIAYIHFARMHQRRGNLDHALDCYNRAIDLAEQLDRPFRKISAMCGIGELLIEQKNFSKAITNLQQTIELADQQHSRYHRTVAGTLWARAAIHDPAVAQVEIERELQHCLRMATAHGSARGIGEASLSLGELMLRDSQPDAARKHLRAAVQSSLSAGTRFLRAPLMLLTPIEKDGDLFADALTEIQRVCAAAGQPSKATLEDKREQETREADTSITLISRDALPATQDLLNVGMNVLQSFPELDVYWRSPESLHFTIMPIKRFNRTFSKYPPPLSIITKLAVAIRSIRVKACGCAVTPNGGIVTLLEPVNHELSALRLVIRLLLPEVDDSQLRYFPHITLGYMQSIGSSDQYDEFRRSIEQAGNALSWEFVVNQVKLVNYRKRNLVEERGSFTFPLGTPDKDQRQPIPTDDEIAAALKLEPPKTGLLDI